MKDKTYILQTPSGVVRIRAHKKPDKKTTNALLKLVEVVNKKYDPEGSLTKINDEHTIQRYLK